jgi:quercetin dioxygenase-like cupin family protein
MEDSKFEAGKTVNFAQLIEYQSDSIVSKQIVRKDTGNISLFAFDRGQRLSEHTAPFDALVQVLQGKANIIIGGIGHELIENQSILMPANIPHAVEATEKFIMLLTMIKG